MKKTDRRVERSQRALRGALLQLMIEKGYDQTTVSDITERANVGRSTFYAHFADKEDLLQQSLQGLKEFLLSNQAVPPEREGPSHPALTFALPMILHADEMRDLIYPLMTGEKGAPVQEQLKIMLTDLVMEKLVQDDSEENTRRQADLLAHFIVGAFLALLFLWLKDPNGLSATQLDQEFRKMALSGLSSV